MKLTKIQLMQLLMGHWELLYKLGAAAQKLADAATDTMVERWEIIKPIGDEIAPIADQLFGAGGVTVSTLSAGTMMTEADMELALIDGVRHAYCDAMANQAASSLVCATGVDADGLAKFEASKQGEYNKVFAASGEEAVRRFDGHRLRGAIKLFQELAPLLTTLGPLLVPLLTGMAGK